MKKSSVLLIFSAIFLVVSLSGNVILYDFWKQEKTDNERLNEELEKEKLLVKAAKENSPEKIQLGKLALNMWNGYEHFNLMDCMNSLDEDHYKALKCAMDMRMEKFV